MRNEPRLAVRPRIVVNDPSAYEHWVYEPMIRRAVKWLGDRHLLAKPINRKEVQCPRQ
jgi:hypothetical protein